MYGDKYADLSLWTTLLSEDARRQGCIKYRGIVGIAALPNTVSAGPQPPFKLHFRPTTPNSKRTILMDLCLRQGKYRCVAGAKMAPPAAAKVMTDVTPQVMAVHVTQTIGYATRHTKVTPQE